MVLEPSDSRFELRGRFAGFFRDVFGKRRMVLRVDGEELYLKVPKPWRRELEGRLRSGDTLVVAGSGRDGVSADRDRRVVTQIRLEGEAACLACPIRVCAGKNCWRSGGRELWRELERQIEDAGLADTVRLKAVDCLDRCKRGPNAEIAGSDFHRCSPHDAEKILLQITGQSETREREKFQLGADAAFARMENSV
jgi:hypothetical protein